MSGRLQEGFNVGMESGMFSPGVRHHQGAPPLVVNGVGAYFLY